MCFGTSPSHVCPPFSQEIVNVLEQDVPFDSSPTAAARCFPKFCYIKKPKTEISFPVKSDPFWWFWGSLNFSETDTKILPEPDTETLGIAQHLEQNRAAALAVSQYKLQGRQTWWNMVYCRWFARGTQQIFTRSSLVLHLFKDRPPRLQGIGKNVLEKHLINLVKQNLVLFQHVWNLIPSNHSKNRPFPLCLLLYNPHEYYSLVISLYLPRTNPPSCSRSHGPALAGALDPTTAAAVDTSTWKWSGGPGCSGWWRLSHFGKSIEMRSAANPRSKLVQVCDVSAFSALEGQCL